MIHDIEELLGQYRTWLQEKTELRSLGDWIEITTPFLDRHNDCIQIYARRDDDSWILTDDGYTVADLEASGCIIGPNGKRRDILDNTLRGFGISLGTRDDLTVRATHKDFAYKKHNLIQAILAAGDLFYLSRARVVSIFFEDVRRWLDENRIRYAPNVRLAGLSGYDHQFEFIIPHSSSKPERLMKLLNIPNKNTAEAAIFSCVDVQATRPIETATYAMINDSQQMPGDVIEALNRYTIKPILWSRKESFVEELAA